MGNIYICFVASTNTPCINRWIPARLASSIVQIRQLNYQLTMLLRAVSVSADNEMAGDNRSEPNLLRRSMSTFEHRSSWLLKINMTGHC